jgi:hypothetical protein
MNVQRYLEIKKSLVEAGYADEVAWYEGLKPCPDALQWFGEYMWVVVSSGMKNQVAQIIADRIWKALESGKAVASAFRHKGKAAAIQRGWDKREELFQGYCSATDKLAYLKALPWIGEITMWHLAKNFGENVAKPDRHLVRIAGEYGMTTAELCEKLARETGDRVATVDVVIWRAANLKML